MGDVISSPVATIQWLIGESTNILKIVSLIANVTSTAIMSYVASNTDRAESQISMVFTDVDEFLSEMAMYGDQAQQCISSRKPEFDKLRSELVASLIECYKSHEQVFVRLQEERKLLHDEAIKLKTEAEEIVANCSQGDESRYICLKNSLTLLSKRMKRLIKKTDIHSKKEFIERRKHVFQIMACDRKAVERAYKIVQKIIQELKHCIFNPKQNELLHDQAE